jgi:hypothetical protein
MTGIKCDFGVDCNAEGKPYHGKRIFNEELILLKS